MKIVALVVSFVGVLSFASPQDSDRIPFSERFPGCDVRLWSAADVTGGRCRFLDEVMVGIRSLDPLVIRCARLEVRCSRPSAPATEKRD